MTIEEFSNEFDILYNNIMSNQSPGLNEYEKSVLLTRAQDDIVKAYLNPKDNKNHEGYDMSPKRQIDFSKLTIYKQLPKITSEDVTGSHFHDGSIRFQFPDDAMIILSEKITVVRDEGKKTLVVVPISVDEYNRLMNKPFTYPLKNQAWRLIVSNSVTHTEIIVGPNDITETSKYMVRYVKRPQPIILVDLSSAGVSINGITDVTNCELDPEIHHEILQRAVELAKSYYTGDLQSQIVLGQNSQTNIGRVAQQNG